MQFFFGVHAATGPFESVFAEGHVYRQAAERPRSFVVVLGVWLIFGMMALTGITLLVVGQRVAPEYGLYGFFIVPISLLMIWKTTRSYFARPRTPGEKRDTEI